jgi:predicted dehydrogenase
MLPEMGPPEATTWDFPGPDASWEREFSAFVDDIAAGRRPDANLDDARAALSVVERIYKDSGYDFR